MTESNEEMGLHEFKTALYPVEPIATVTSLGSSEHSSERASDGPSDCGQHDVLSPRLASPRLASPRLASPRAAPACRAVRRPHSTYFPLLALLRSKTKPLAVTWHCTCALTAATAASSTSAATPLFIHGILAGILAESAPANNCGHCSASS